MFTATLLAAGLMLALAHDANADGAAAHARPGQTMKLRLTIGAKILSATLVDSPTTRDFLALLPLSLTMNDLFGREKFAPLPRALAEGGERRRDYAIGDVIYWSPGPDVAIYYRSDEKPIPPPGIIVLGRIDGSVEALDVSGSVKVTIAAE
ncbi:cyclophilin-like fold protein [Bradyrhizobium sp. USDA 4353]